MHHDRIKTYEIFPNIENQEIINSLPQSFTIRDELYLHEIQPNISIIQETIINGHKEPVAWVKQMGKGKVAYFAPGHRAAVFSITPVKKTLIQLIEWCVTDE